MQEAWLFRVYVYKLTHCWIIPTYNNVHFHFLRSGNWFLEQMRKKKISPTNTQWKLWMKAPVLYNIKKVSLKEGTKKMFFKNANQYYLLTMITKNRFPIPIFQLSIVRTCKRPLYFKISTKIISHKMLKVWAFQIQIFLYLNPTSLFTSSFNTQPFIETFLWASIIQRTLLSYFFMKNYKQKSIWYIIIQRIGSQLDLDFKRLELMTLKELSWFQESHSCFQWA